MNHKELMGVILAADQEDAIKKQGFETPHAMLFIGDKPLMQYHIECMRDIGIKDLLILVKYKKDEIIKYFGNGRNFDVNIQYVEQTSNLGIAHAVGQLESYIDKPFILILSDIFFVSKNFGVMIETAFNKNASVVLAAKKTEDPHFNEMHFGIVLHYSKMVKRVVEKPKYFLTPLKGCGIYYFDTVIFDAIRRTPRTAIRDKYEITDSIQILIDDGYPVWHAEVIDDYTHINSEEDILKCSKLMGRYIKQEKPDIK